MDICSQCEELFPGVESIGVLIGKMHVYRGGKEGRVVNEKLVFCSVDCALEHFETILEDGEWA